MKKPQGTHSPGGGLISSHHLGSWTQSDFPVTQEVPCYVQMFKRYTREPLTSELVFLICEMGVTTGTLPTSRSEGLHRKVKHGTYFVDSEKPVPAMISAHTISWPLDDVIFYKKKSLGTILAPMCSNCVD